MVAAGGRKISRLGYTRRVPSSSGGGSFKGGAIVQEMSEETTLIAASIISVVTLYVTRTLWYPATTVHSLLPQAQCHFPVMFNAKGVVEGPWVNATWQQSSPLLRGAMSAQDLANQDKLVALNFGSDDAKLKPEHLAQGLEAFEEKGNVVTLSFARLAERYLATWLSIDGVRKGLGKKGLVKDISLRSIASNVKLAPCVSHLRIVAGRVYFRYGSFLQCPKKLRRLNLMVLTIQEAVDKYRLQALKAELYINVCDEPQSYDNSLSSGKSGFAVFSTHLTPGSTDILCPDPLDLLNTKDIPPASTLSWPRRSSKAVWRGEGFEFDLRVTNWASSLKLRLHRMSDARPDLLDARVTMWGSKDKEEAKSHLVRSGVVLGTPLTKSQQRDEFKYTLVVDEKVGTTEMCAALLGPQAIIRHASGFTQFFEPLLLPGVHYMPVRHSLADLYDAIEWMNANDAAAQQMVRNANEIAPLICSQEGQVHFWAVLLSKYSSRAMENPDAVKAPKVCKGGKGIDSADWANEKSKPTCKHPSNDRCTDFCVDGKPEKQWTWLDSQMLGDLASAA